MTVVPWPVQGEEKRPISRPAEPIVPASALLARVVGIAPAVATDLLAHHGLLGALRYVDAGTLQQAHGLTRRQAARLHDALELAACLLVEPHRERPRVTTPRDAARLLLPEMSLLEQEEMRLLLLDTRHRLLAAVPLYAGTACACHVRVAEVFREAVRRNATALIVAHNHPSGATDPSPEDVAITREIVAAGRLLDIEVLDHLILGRDGRAYTSLRERNLGWE